MFLDWPEVCCRAGRWRRVIEKAPRWRPRHMSGGRDRARPLQTRCPITLDRFVDPVITADGHTFERAAIERWLEVSDISPTTGLALPSRVLIPNHTLRALLDEIGGDFEHRISSILWLRICRAQRSFNRVLSPLADSSGMHCLRAPVGAARPRGCDAPLRSASHTGCLHVRLRTPGRRRAHRVGLGARRSALVDTLLCARHGVCDGRRRRERDGTLALISHRRLLLLWLGPRARPKRREQRTLRRPAVPY